MKNRKTICGVEAMLLLAGIGIGATMAQAETLNVGPGETYVTIQAAIDDANYADTINVAAGYDSSSETFPIIIDKSLRLVGEQEDIDPRPDQGGRTGDETVIDAGESSDHVLLIETTNDVEINGFTITGGTGDMVEREIQPELAVASAQSEGIAGDIEHNFLFCYNILYDELTGGGGKAIQIKYSDDTVIEYNYAYNIQSDAFNLSRSANGVIRYNEAHDIHSEDAAIFCYGDENTDIVGNLVYNVINNDGIKLGASWEPGTGGNVRDNEVHDAAEDGITIYATDVTVENNIIYRCGSENGAMNLDRADNTNVAGNLIFNNDAIGLMIKSSANVTVTGNEISANSDDGTKYPGSAGIWLESNTTVTAINNNYVHCNTDFGLRNDTGTIVNAEYNWWGHPSGPAHAGNPTGIGDTVSDNVDYEPWLEHSLGDINHDCCVNMYDYSMLAAAWQSSTGDTNYNPACDIDASCDSAINILDLAVFVAHWSECSTPCN